MSPMVFQAAMSANGSSSGQLNRNPSDGCELGKATQHDVINSPSINPLTREQLQQALIHMLKTDSDFLCKIHSAYVESLNRGLGGGRP
jgi:hypothetical protein